MKISEKVAYWLDIAEYDMKTARSLHNKGKADRFDPKG